MKECLAKPYIAIETVINDIHFNIDNPQNMNIINSNRRDNTVKVYDYDFKNELGWITQNKNAACELLHHKTVNILSKIPNKLKKNNIKIDSQKEFNLNKHIANLEYDKETIKESIKKINNITYDKHKIALIYKKNNNLIK